MRKSKDGGGTVTVMKPVAVKEYTKYMDGCDVQDQKRSYYDIRVKAGCGWVRVVEREAHRGVQLLISFV